MSFGSYLNPGGQIHWDVYVTRKNKSLAAAVAVAYFAQGRFEEAASSAREAACEDVLALQLLGCALFLGKAYGWHQCHYDDQTKAPGTHSPLSLIFLPTSLSWALIQPLNARLGHEQAFHSATATSALPPKADIHQCGGMSALAQ